MRSILLRWDLVGLGPQAPPGNAQVQIAGHSGHSYRGARRDKSKHLDTCIRKRSARCYRTRCNASFDPVIFDNGDEYIYRRLWK